MTTTTFISRFTGGLAALLLCSALAQAAKPAKPAQRTFPSPKAAADALVAAAEKFDAAALKAIFGPDGADLVITEDTVQDKNRAEAFARRAHEKLVVATDPKQPGRAALLVGADDYPMPVPLVQSGSTWRFDPKSGRRELLLRRIGANELDAIQVCQGFVEAQHEYASSKHDGAPVNQYAQRIVSSAGKQDGLAWKGAAGAWEGPVGERLARVIAEGYTEKLEPYHGYLFKVLKGQGPAAPLGQLDFMVKGAMIGGFALVAAPADYRKTGVKTFIVSHAGVVYEKDLGPKTLEAFKKIERFNPDKGWKAVAEP